MQAAAPADRAALADRQLDALDEMRQYFQQEARVYQEAARKWRRRGMYLSLLLGALPVMSGVTHLVPPGAAAFMGLVVSLANVVVVVAQVKFDVGERIADAAMAGRSFDKLATQMAVDLCDAESQAEPPDLSARLAEVRATLDMVKTNITFPEDRPDWGQGPAAQVWSRHPGHPPPPGPALELFSPRARRRSRGDLDPPAPSPLPFHLQGGGAPPPPPPPGAPPHQNGAGGQSRRLAYSVGPAGDAALVDSPPQRGAAGSRRTITPSRRDSTDALLLQSFAPQQESSPAVGGWMEDPAAGGTAAAPPPARLPGAHQPQLQRPRGDGDPPAAPPRPAGAGAAAEAPPGAAGDAGPAPPPERPAEFLRGP